MNVEQRERFYELLIRGREDGSIAAHVRRISEVVVDGQIVAATEGPAIEIAIASDMPPELDALLSEAMVGMHLAQEAAITERDAALRERDIAVSERDAALSRTDGVETTPTIAAA